MTGGLKAEARRKKMGVRVLLEFLMEVTLTMVFKKHVFGKPIANVQLDEF